jgi:hypothetical protein
MIVCPVCEHAQHAGVECDVCGKLLDAAAAAALDVRLEGLEPTAFAPAAAAAGAVEGLEPTRLATVDAVPAAVGPDLEPTRTGPVDADAPPLEGLERTEAGIPDDGPTLVPLVVTCRYCRSPAAEGERLCARCGMRLPVVEVARAQAEAAAEARRCGCGAAVPGGGARCPGCGRCIFPGPP